MTLNKIGLSLLANLTLIVGHIEAEFSLVWELWHLHYSHLSYPKYYCELIRCTYFSPRHHPQVCLPESVCLYLLVLMSCKRNIWRWETQESFYVCGWHKLTPLLKLVSFVTIFYVIHKNFHPPPHLLIWSLDDCLYDKSCFCCGLLKNGILVFFCTGIMKEVPSIN